MTDEQARRKKNEQTDEQTENNSVTYMYDPDPSVRSHIKLYRPKHKKTYNTWNLSSMTSLTLCMSTYLMSWVAFSGFCGYGTSSVVRHEGSSDQQWPPFRHKHFIIASDHFRRVLLKVSSNIMCLVTRLNSKV